MGKKKKVEIQKIYTLTPMQEGMLFHSLMDDSSNAYFEQTTFTLRGEPDMGLFEKSFNFLVKRYDILRTIFNYKKTKTPIQVVLKDRPVKVAFRDIRQTENASAEIYADLIEESRLKDRAKGFDLTRDALMRITVLQTADDTYNVLWSFHHILMDGWCLGIVMDDFFSIYESLRKGREPELGAYYPFGNYIKWLEKQDREEAARYWQSYLGGAEEEHGGRFSLFGSHPDHRAEDEAYRPIISDFTIDEELTSKMSELANRRNTTTNTIIQTAWGLLLQHYSRSNDVVFGSVVSGRSAKLEGIEKMVGLFINTIPVRVRKDRHKTFEQLMDLVQEEALASTRYDYFPLAEIQAGTSLKKDLLDHIIVFENYPMEQEIQQIGDVDKLGFVIDGVQLFEQTSYDLNIIVIPGNSLTVRMNYNAARYPNASFMERLTGHFKAILQQGVAKPGTKAEDIHILTDAEKEKILEQFNGIRDDSPQPETIHQWFLNQVQKTPEHTAVVHTEAGEDEESLTYEQLEERACRLAHALRERGVGADTIVGVMAGRSLDMITAMMGILLAGGAYLPIDPGFPESRIRYMITDSRIRQILTDLPKENLRFVPETVEILDIRKELTGSCKESGEMPAHINKNSDLLYMIYTSGSTGQPKGVMLEHRNLVNLLMHQYEHTLIDFSRVLQFTTISFDVSFQEIFSTLLSGGTLHLIKEETRKDVERLFGIVDTFDIKTLFLPVSFLKFVSGEDEYIQQMPDCVEHIVTAGEQVVINDRLRGCLKDNNIRLHNHYGPSETHVVTEIMLDPFGDLPTLPSIGKPVLNTGIYLLAPNMHPQPEGVPGELYIGGIQVGRGYMGRADETAKRFITNPFRSDEKLYRSGDLARWLPDGNIEFIGRVDFQVKIRGFRIELGEIEARLTRQENIKAAVVIARKDDTGGNYLCAYFTAEVELTVPQLRDFLLEDLPEYMLPSYFIQLETFPVTPTGKVDRRALPAPDGPVDTGIEYTPPRDEVEEKLVDIWQDILKVKRVGIDDDFFHLGGHSLKATMLTGRIFKELNVEFPLSRLFKSPTVRGIARFINGADENMYAAIEPAAQRHYYSLSTAQKRLYILDGFENKEPGAAVGYHIPAVLEIEGKVDADKFTQVFKTLVERHESLRTSFKLVEGQPVQEIHPKVNFSIEHLQITEKSASPTRKEQIESLLRPFDLSKAPLLRVGLISEGEERHILVVDMHHIVSDGTSIAVIVREFVDLYDGKELPPMRLQYKDYSVWQHETFKTGILKEQEVYWKKRLSGDIPVLEMPLDYPRPAEQSFEGAALYFALEADVTAKLKTFASERQVTLYMLLLAAYNVLLARYSGQDDILVGSPVAGRPHPDLENIVGMFVNTLVMRNFPHSEKTFSNFLAELKDNTLKVYENQDYPFESLVELLDLKRDLGRNPLFDTMFTLQNVDIPDIGVEGLTFTPIEYDNGSSTFDVSVTAVEVGNRLEFSIEYGTRLFAGETIERFGAHFTNALEFLLQDPDKPLADIDILTFEERKQVLYGFNDNYGDFDADTPLHRLFSQQVERTPDETAVVGPLGGEGSAYNRSLTYRQLEEKASQLARLLRDKGVGPDTIVGIMVERSVEMISGLFGILKAGGAYLPIDPSHPRDRIDYMLADSGAEVLLTSHSLAQNVTFEKEIFLLEEPEPGSEEGSGKSLSATQAMRAYTDEGSNLAYIIYTSGTTGKPKGVAVEHRNITAYIQAFLNICDLHGNDVIVSVASYSFDAFGEELYPMLFRGGTFVIPSKEEITDFNRLVNLMVEYKATVANASPLLMNQLSKFSRQLADIRYVIVGGDVARLDHVKNFLPQATVLNTYGPTETTICATYHKCGEKDPQALPIGQPYTNYMVYIVAGGERVLPVGVPGELCISGVGVARGYLNRPQLTAEKFIENPFVPQERLYRSGDLARWTPDGTIQFLGRIDNQVNIRGFRIELGEVEYRLQAYQNIDAAVVVPRDDEDGDKFLCGYYTTTDETVGQLPVGDLRDFLTLELPEYMVPAFFIYMESFPLSPTGKVNKRALPEPGGEITTGVPYAPPSGKVEETLVELWQDILKAETVGIDDNFFRLGGHSLKAAVLSGRIYKALSVEFPLSQIFNSPTVRQMAHYLQGVEETAYASIQPVEPSDNYPLSSSQKRVYALQQIEGRQSAVSYNIPDVLRISGRPDRELFTDIFRRLIKRHESLRTSFEMVGEKTVQIVHDSAQFDVEYYDVSKEEADDERTQRFRIQNGSLVPEGSPDEDDRETETNLLDEFIRPFDLSRAPLLRVGLIRETDDTHILALDMHHIISDGSSISTLVNEFVRLYLGETLPPLRIQYKDFAVWQKRLYEEGVMLKQEEFWKTQFEGDIPVMDMPTDFQRPQVQSFDGESISFTLNSHLTELLKELASLRHATLYMALSAVYNVLLSRYTGQQDIVVGCPVAGRPHPDLEQVVGMFINTLPIRYSPLEGTSFADFLEQAKDVTLRAFENQEFPFDELVETLDVRRDLSHNPLFDTMLVLQNFDTPGLTVGDLVFQPLDYDTGTSKLDMTLNAVEVEGELVFHLEYCTRLFHRERMERLGEHFINIVRSVVEKPTVLLKNIDILSEKEREQILVTFNDTAREYPENASVGDLFIEQAERNPEAIALVSVREPISGDREGTDSSHEPQPPVELSYRALDEESEALARVLQGRGVFAGDIVAVMTDRTVELIVGILAVLKVGAVYMPLQPDYPRERLRYFLADSNAKMLLTIKRLARFDFDLDTIYLEELPGADVSPGEPVRLVSPVKGNDLVYVIYTSGTTGIPKGVMVEHRGVVRLVRNTDFVEFREGDCILQTCSIVFDVTTFELWGALLNGLKLILVDKDTLLDVPKFKEALTVHRVTILFLTPALFNRFAEQDPGLFRDLSYLVVGGDVVSPPHAARVSAVCPEVKIVNGYGPTENTTFSTCFYVKDTYESAIPIGPPIANSTAYVMDKHGRLQPIGIPGELWVGGEGVARGYMNRPELTREKFLSCNISSTGPGGTDLSSESKRGAEGQILYRTGDLTKWLPNGCIDFLGRIDHQVKIRGFRIEMGEIETQLLEHPGVKEAVVVDRKDERDDKYLCVYVVPEHEFTIRELQEHLARRLPDYMIPSVYVRMETFPLNANGKVDRKNLPAPETEDRLLTGAEYEAPCDDIEEKMALAWTEVLGVNQAGVHDNFFSRGGDSIRAIQLSGRMRAFGLKIEVKDLFRKPTIRQLRPLVARLERKAFQGIVEGTVPLTPIQHWFFQREETLHHHWNQSFMLFRKEGFDEDALNKVLEKWLEHHDALRMTYTPEHGHYSQQNRGMDNQTLLLFKTFDMPESDVEVFMEAKGLEIQTGLNVIDGPAVGVGLFKSSAGHHLLIAIHHLVVDGISWRILLEDFSTGYQQAVDGAEVVFPEKTDSFKEWSERLQVYAAGRALLRQKDYWRNLDLTAVPPLPEERHVYYDLLSEAKTLTVKLDQKTTGQLLKEAGQAYNTEINHLLLTALGLALQQWTENSRFAVNLEGHGREQIMDDIDVSRTVGWFTSAFPVILDIPDPDDLSHCIRLTKENLNRIPEKGVGYGILQSITPDDKKEGFAFSLKPRISFNYLGQTGQDVKEGLFSMSPYSGGEMITPESKRDYVLDINGIVTDGRLEMGFNFNKEQYSENTIHTLAGNFNRHLIKIIHHCLLQTVVVRTPSDFDRFDLTLQEFDQLADALIYPGQPENKMEIAALYPLTPMQSGMLFHHLMDTESVAYFEQSAFTLHGTLDLPLFQKSFNLLVERYDILRTVFLHGNLKTPLQVVLSKREVELFFRDLTQMDAVKKTAFVNQFGEKDKQRGFVLHEDVMMRISILQTAGQSFKVFWSFHHILMDGWCLGILMEEFFKIYTSLKNDGEAPQLPEVYAYGDYIRWLEKQDMEEAGSYWKKMLEGSEAGGRISAFAVPPEKRELEFIPEHTSFQVPEALTQRLQALSTHTNVTVNTLFQALWGIVLHRYSHIDDIVFGSVVSGRSARLEGIEKMVGLFINTIPVHIRCSDHESFLQLIKTLQENSLASAQYEYYPLARIQSDSPMGQDLLDHIMVFENYPMEKEIEQIGDGNLGFSIGEVDFFEQTNYDFSFTIFPGDTLTVQWNYNEAAYPDGEFFNRMSRHFMTLLEACINEPRIQLGRVDMLTKSEKEQMLVTFNDSACDYPKEKKLHQLFRECAERTPDAVALEGPVLSASFLSTKIDGVETVEPADSQEQEENRPAISLTYSALNHYTDQLAKQLVAHRIGCDSIAAVMLEQSCEAIISLLAILKAGGAYLPISPKYPEERINFILRDSEAEVLLTIGDFAGKADFNGKFLLLDSRDVLKTETQQTTDAEKLAVMDGTPDSTSNLAYVLYTSGTTGNPKGVLVEHGNAVNQITAMICAHGYTQNLNHVLVASFTFDASVVSLFSPLLSCGRLVLPGENRIHGEPRKLWEFISRRHIHVLLSVPGFVGALLENLPQDLPMQLNWMLLGGDALPPRLVEALRKQLPGMEHLINIYGPTETTVIAVQYKCGKHEPDGSVPIGTPVANYTAYILDPALNPVPFGVNGELCVGGDSVARGYLNRPELTHEKFIENPCLPGQVLYKTGDLCSWREDGNIMFTGRVDHQVKIRGFRIELGEIEAYLCRYPSVMEAVVIAHENASGVKSLYAYITPARQEIPAIVEFLADQLPGYMVPARIIALENFHKTPAGKINRKLLPDPGEKSTSQTPAAPPADEIEGIMVQVWTEVLGFSVDVNDDFFACGGDSIKAIQLVGRLQKYQLKMEIKDLFKHPSIRDLRPLVVLSRRRAFQGIVTGDIPLTPIQHWFFQQQKDQISHWNQAVMLFASDGFDEAITRRVLARLVHHHDALRIHYAPQNDPVLQVNRGMEDDDGTSPGVAGPLFTFQLKDYRQEPDAGARIEAEANEHQKELDLEKGPLFNIVLFKTAEGDHLLFIIHHVVVDVISWRILVEDFQTGYSMALDGQSPGFQDKTDSFKDWAEKQRDFAHGKKLLRELEYWKAIEQADIPALPMDRKAVSNRAKDSLSCSITLSAEETRSLLTEAGAAYHTEINDLLLTALGLAFKQWTGNDKILIQLEGHGREPFVEDIDISRTIGWFTCTFPVLLDMTASEDISYQLRFIKETLRRVPNKGIGYGMLQYLTPLENTGGFQAPGEILFNYIGETGPASTGGKDSAEDSVLFEISPLAGGDVFSPESHRTNTFSINGLIVDGRLEVGFEYNKMEYDESTVQNIADLFRQNLQEIISHCKDRLENPALGVLFTPSDYGSTDLSLPELENLQGLLHRNLGKEAQIKEIYPLTPMQEGMLFHTLMDDGSNAYFEQTSFTVEGELDPELFQQAFNQLLERYDILRTAFYHKDTTKPLQVVLEERFSQIHLEDISEEPEESKPQLIAAFRQKDKDRGFSLDI
ncbi:MAG: amino acid adenylation domain-containing protein, partial [bacterium]|nr:amino acid adenylation domain-containing protein [bacterium]